MKIARGYHDFSKRALITRVVVLATYVIGTFYKKNQ